MVDALRCWEAGPRIKSGNYSVGSTCLLPDGHSGLHEFIPNNLIQLRVLERPRNGW